MQNIIDQDPPTDKESVSRYPILINLGAWVFWITFVLSFLISRPLSIITLGVYRTGVVVLGLSALLLLTNLVLVNRQLFFGVLVLCCVILLSAVVNGSSLIQLLGFIRIPITTYLVYYLVAVYLTSRKRIVRVLKIMYLIALIQLPVLMLQRVSYPYLPARVKFGALTGQLSLFDFGMGTFNGDAVMSFFLISLIILLLFWRGSHAVVKRKWLMAIWLTLTVLVGNSQIQHLILVGVWAVYFLLHLRPKTIIIIVLGVLIMVGALIYLEQSGILTFAPMKHTLARASLVFSEEIRKERIELFLNGKHARDGAILYYLNEPVNWLGDGPGRYLNVITRERIRNWGHIFTFYAEVGLIGLLLSYLVLFLLTFPISIQRSKIRLRISWVQIMMFLSIVFLSMARYPMNTIGMIFTYCVILVGYRLLDKPKYLRIY